MLSKKLLLCLVFILILLTMGTADYILTGGTFKFPSAQEGIAKKTEPDVTVIAESQGLSVTETTERNLLSAVLPATARTGLSARVLLKDNDRAATIAWIDSRDVKEIFTALRKSLRPKFSVKLLDLIDETQSQAGKPPRDVLSFLDPAINPERLLFVRVRERLYEIHMTEGHEDEVNRLIDALTE
ncbi:MAG: hypothetical protein HOO67_07330 [Candidatus Peribacteraceae bacterium]|nr:hypothetical protein [Candidatus Peribacteraceae bacterium]